MLIHEAQRDAPSVRSCGVRASAGNHPGKVKEHASAITLPKNLFAKNQEFCR